MVKHKFRVGERVEFTRDRLDGDVTSGAYTITRCMPGEGSELQYRVKSAHESHERVMNESQLRKS